MGLRTFIKYHEFQNLRKISWVCWKFVVYNCKNVNKEKQRVVDSIGKIGIEVILLTLLYFEKHNNILSLIDIDARIKFIYIDSSHIKLFR